MESIRQATQELTSRGIMVLIDAHQDMYNEKFEGEFAPDWAVIDDGLPSFPQIDFPNNQVVNIGLIPAYDNFLANRVRARRRQFSGLLCRNVGSRGGFLRR